MNVYLADTSFYIAAANPRDALHTATLQLARQLVGTIITTDFVLLEVGNWLSRSGDRSVFIRLMEQLEVDTDTQVIPATHNLFDLGFELYTRRPDKDWSLTDCISFVVMRQHNLTEALTADHHFEQAGFTALMA